MDCEALRDDLLAVLYGEADAEAQARVEAHSAACADCREELAALRGLRRTLAAWKLPEQAAPRARGGFAAWRGVAAAAALLLALGGALGLSGAHFQYAGGGLVVRLGREPADLRALLAAQEERHKRELAALEARIGTPARATAQPDEAELLERMEALIRSSEERQARLLNASLSELDRKSEAQRRYDLARISAGFSYLEGKTGRQVARTTELMGYMLEASQKR